MLTVRKTIASMKHEISHHKLSHEIFASTNIILSVVVTSGLYFVLAILGVATMIKYPIVRLVLHLLVWAVLAIALFTSQGCARHTEIIILKHPNSIEYAEAMQNWGER